jgi:hypothetical protein
VDEGTRTAFEKRVGDRAQVRRAALVIQERKRFGRVKELQIDAEIRDVSVSGALVAVQEGAPLSIGQGCDLEIAGERGRAWVRRLAAEDGELLCGVEFMDARPAFLPTIYQWLGREDIDDTKMR